MRICFIVDAGSPIAQNWVQYFVQQGHDVHVISTYPCSDDAIPGAKIYPAPIAFSGLGRGSINENRKQGSAMPSVRSLLRRSKILFDVASYAVNWLAPVEFLRHVGRYRDLIARIQPDIVHAMRIPYEGLIAAKAVPPDLPLVVSIWGNDFTLFAEVFWIIGQDTRQAMRRANALHADTQRDLRLATRWGFDSRKPEIFLPGCGGVRTDLFHPGERQATLFEELQIPSEASIVINPRGLRWYVCNDAFFQSIPLVLQEQPNAVFVCIGMQGNKLAERWVDELGIRNSTRLLSKVSRGTMADLFRLAEVSVSPSRHDGTPNTLLEAMACGCFPVAGDIESVREWIDDGGNGLLCDPANPHELAEAILKAMQNRSLRDQARELNLHLIQERAEYNNCMAKANQFYEQVLGVSGRGVAV